ncbi:C4-dicarboxylate TRAP transporter substrate-binding protein [Pararhodobacter aggregans]|nr:C4-dicarboxylate TRAP transporter substrate-binding protein [Pararhodobacter aggregans]PTX03034.1 TRAP-type C4-dicarboxylate transport system substrate-binding protein [Pararhodobacter aggregans]
MSIWNFTRRKVMATALLAAFVPTTLAAQATYHLRFAEIGPPRGARAEAMQQWADDINTRSNGQVEIEFFWGGALASPSAMVEAVGSGLADIGVVVAEYSAHLPRLLYANIAYIENDPWVAMRATFDTLTQADPVHEQATENGIQFLMNFAPGPIQILSREPVLSVEDFQGLRYRSTGAWLTWGQNMGAIPVALPLHESYQAIERGIVDAMAGFLSPMMAYKLYEVVPHVTMANAGQTSSYGITINKELFDSMPEELRAIILEASIELMDHYGQALIEETDAIRAQLTEGVDGFRVQFHDLPEEELARWRERAAFQIPEYIEETNGGGADGQAIWDIYAANLDRYREIVATEGYPWAR